jgi:hypothetical protein
MSRRRQATADVRVVVESGAFGDGRGCGVKFLWPEAGSNGRVGGLPRAGAKQSGGLRLLIIFAGTLGGASGSNANLVAAGLLLLSWFAKANAANQSPAVQDFISLTANEEPCLRPPPGRDPADLAMYQYLSSVPEANSPFASGPTLRSDKIQPFEHSPSQPETRHTHHTTS